MGIRLARQRPCTRLGWRISITPLPITLAIIGTAIDLIDHARLSRQADRNTQVR
jgi:hypothetical protein